MAKGIRYGVVTVMTGITCAALAFNGAMEGAFFAVCVAIFGGFCAMTAVDEEK